MGQPTTNQAGFRGRYDDGGETGATWIAALDTHWTQDADTVFRTRFLLTNTGDKTESKAYALWYSYNSAAYVRATTTSAVIKCAESAETSWTIADQDPTTQQLGSGSFSAGEYDESGETTAIDLLAGNETETEWCLSIVSGDVDDGDTIDLQMRFSDDVELDNYLTGKTPRITVNIPAGDVYVTPAAAAANASGQSPAVILGTHSMTPAHVEADASGINPAVVLGAILLTPGVAEALASAISPTVRLGSHTALPGYAEANAGAIDPVVVLGSHSLTPATLEALAAALDPSVSEGGGVMVSPAEAAALAATVDPTVLLGSHSMTPGIAEALASTVDPALILSSMAVTPAQAIALALAMNPNVIEGLPSGVRKWVALNLLTLGVGGRRG